MSEENRNYRTSRRKFLGGAATVFAAGLAGCGAVYDRPDEGEEGYEEVDLRTLLLDSDEYEHVRTEGYIELGNADEFECPGSLERVYKLFPSEDKDSVPIYVAEVNFLERGTSEPPEGPIRELDGEELIEGTTIEVWGELEDIHRVDGFWSGCEDGETAIYAHGGELKSRENQDSAPSISS